MHTHLPLTQPSPASGGVMVTGYAVPVTVQNHFLCVV